MQAALDAYKAAAETAGVSPLHVAGVVFEAIRKEQFYIFPNPEWIELVKLRMDKLLQMENPQSAEAAPAKMSNPPGSWPCWPENRRLLLLSRLHRPDIEDEDSTSESSYKPHHGAVAGPEISGSCGQSGSGPRIRD